MIVMSGKRRWVDGLRVECDVRDIRVHIYNVLYELYWDNVVSRKYPVCVLLRRDGVFNRFSLVLKEWRFYHLLDELVCRGLIVLFPVGDDIGVYFTEFDSSL